MWRHDAELVAIGNWIAGGGIAAATGFLNAQVLIPLVAALPQMIAVATKTVVDSAMFVHGTFGNAVYGAAAAAMLLPVLSSGGLYLTMKQPRGKRIAAYAQR